MDYNELSDYRRRMSIAVKAAGICVFELNVTRQMYTFFENSEAIFGVPGERILEDVRPFSKLSPDEYHVKAAEYFAFGDDADVVEKAFKCVLSGQPVVYEARMRAADSSYAWCRVCVTPCQNSRGENLMVGVISNIQSVRKKIDALIYESKLETFTRLYTKQSFEAICEGLLKNEEYKGERFALVMIDLDDFKRVNDTYGHMAGDEVIAGVAEHLKAFFRGGDLICRYGGDEFAVLMRNVGSAESVKRRIDQFLAESDNRYGVTKSAGIVVTSVGDAAYVQGEDSQRERFRRIFNRADEAMYLAKREKNRSVLA